jgi:hypothetical protein
VVYCRCDDGGNEAITGFRKFVLKEDLAVLDDDDDVLALVD